MHKKLIEFQVAVAAACIHTVYNALTAAAAATPTV